MKIYKKLLYVYFGIIMATIVLYPLLREIVRMGGFKCILLCIIFDVFSFLYARILILGRCDINVPYIEKGCKWLAESKNFDRFIKFMFPLTEEQQKTKSVKKDETSLVLSYADKEKILEDQIKYVDKFLGNYLTAEDKNKLNKNIRISSFGLDEEYQPLSLKIIDTCYSKYDILHLLHAIGYHGAVSHNGREIAIFAKKVFVNFFADMDLDTIQKKLSFKDYDQKIKLIGKSNRLPVD